MGSNRKESILNLNKYIEKSITVKFTGGREGFDTLMNLVLDDCDEFIRDPEDPYKLTNEKRRLGLVVCRGSVVMLISPTDGTEEIANPFLDEAVI